MVAITVAVEGVDAALEHICPNTADVIVDESTEAFRGFSKLAWLKILKNSARNCNLNRSVRTKFFSEPMSKSRKKDL